MSTTFINEKTLLGTCILCVRQVNVCHWGCTAVSDSETLGLESISSAAVAKAGVLEVGFTWLVLAMSQIVAAAATHVEGIEDDDGDILYEGDPRPMPYAFEKELIEKSNKHIRLSAGFVPVTKVYPLTHKFYAHHEQRKPLEPQRFLRYTEVAQHERRTKLGTPLLESQVYGWLPLSSNFREHAGAAVHLNFMHAPKLRCRMTVHGEKLTAERITERAPFNGLRFLIH